MSALLRSHAPRNRADQSMIRQSTRKRGAPEDAPPPAKRAKLAAISKTGPKPHASRGAANTPRARLPFEDTVPSQKLNVYVFGDGSAGELGLGTRNARDVSCPRHNAKLDGIVDVSAGGMHAAAVTTDGSVLTWGVNDEHALGRDTTWDGGLRDVGDANESGSDSDDGELNPREATPTAIPMIAFPPDTKIVQVAAGDSATFMLTQHGDVYGCGTFRDSNGKFGLALESGTSDILEFSKTPVHLPNLSKIKSISAGADFALALDDAGRVFAWGVGEQQQLGRRLVARRRHLALVPTRVELPKTRTFVSIHAGADHAFAIDTDGDTWAWGLNNFAQTGIMDRVGQDAASIDAPRKVPSLVGKRMKMVQGGRHHSIAVTQAGECLVWGRMDGGQMGFANADLPVGDAEMVLADERGRPRVLLQPTPLPLPSCVFAAAGSDHNIAIDADGRAYSWGFNVNYQCGQGNSNDILVAKLMNSKSIRDVKTCWAGAGGQFSMLASAQSDAN